MVTQVLYLALLAVLGLERLYELSLSKRHARWAFERGGIEFGRGHLLAMRLLHTAFFFGCAAEVLLLDRPFVAALAWPMLALAGIAQGLRYWAVRTLGPLWNIRVIVVPGQPAVTGGPFRYLRHPNYLAVVLEGIAIPLLHSAWLTALSFSVLNAVLLSVRIRCEERALRLYCGYGARSSQLAPLWPRMRSTARGGFRGK